MRAPAQTLAQAHIKTAIARLQRRYDHTLLCEPRHPSAIRPQARPTAAAQGQHQGLGLGDLLAVGCVKTHLPACVGGVEVTQPTVAHVKAHGHALGGVAQAV